MIKNQQVMPFKISLLWLLVVAVVSTVLCAPKVLANGVAALFTTEEQRKHIDQQRVIYLTASLDADSRPSKQPYANAKMRVAIDTLAQDLAVSAVIDKPNGERIVRINNRFQTLPAGKNLRVGGAMGAVTIKTPNHDRTSHAESSR